MREDALDIAHGAHNEHPQGQGDAGKQRGSHDDTGRKCIVPAMFWP